jgi:hypothetical protein
MAANDHTPTNNGSDNEILKHKTVSAILLKHINLLKYDPNNKIQWQCNLDKLKSYTEVVLVYKSSLG